mgnify:CR=1 FL=1
MLIKALFANALFSGACGIGIFVVHPALIPHIPLPSIMFIILGLGLILFSGGLLWLCQSQKLAQRLAPLVIGADIMWVIASCGLTALFYEFVTTTGLLAILAVNVVVTLLGGLQYIGYKQGRFA